MTEPTPPRMVLRLGVVGSRKLEGTERTRLDERLEAILGLIEGRLTALRADRDGLVEALYDPDAAPLVRVVSGLADGVDQIVSDRALARAGHTGDASWEIAAVLPFETATYRDKSPITETATFDRLLAACCVVLELDGIYEARPNADKPDAPENDLASAKRARAYRAQAAVLLRQSDLLLAVNDIRATGRAGGTAETVRRALELAIPVVHLDPTTGHIRVLRLPAELETAALADPAPDAWMETLRGLVDRVILGPRARDPQLVQAHRPLLAELLNAPEPRDMESKSRGAAPQSATQWLHDRGTCLEQRVMRLLGQCWDAFSNAFRRLSLEGRDQPLDELDPIRRRASDLSQRYIGAYRGALVAVSALAFCAVLVALMSMLAFIFIPPAYGNGPDPQKLALIILAAVKLILVSSIAILIYRARKGEWNERGVALRYLAERLRIMYYLPRLGAARLIPAATGLYTAVAERHTLMDTVAAAFVRAADPALSVGASGRANLAEPLAPRPLSRAHLAPVVEVLGQGLQFQVSYHKRTEDSSRRLADWLEHATERANKLVLIVLAIDIIALALLIIFPANNPLEPLKKALAPVLIAITALLPAAVASLISVRSQSECVRLAERSEHLQHAYAALHTSTQPLLAGLRQPPTPADLGAHITEAIDLAESAARLSLTDVAEWSAIYTREIVEP